MNAEMKSRTLDYEHLYKVVIHDVYSQLDVSPIEESRDITYLNQRLRYEGLPFVTKVVPALGKAVLSAFQSGRFSCPLGLKKARRAGALPALLQGLLKRVFDTDGCLLSSACAEDVWGIQQICFLLYKYELPYDPRLIQSKFINLKQVNESLPKTLSELSLGYEERTVLSLARDIVREMMSGVDLKDIKPSNGPGSTSKGRMSLTEKLHYIHESPHVEGYPNGVYARVISLDSLTFWSLFDVLIEPICRADRMSVLHFVPKDSRGPRAISCEPPQLMWIQQGQRAAIEAAALRYSDRRINFDDQSINAELALRASLDNSMATLDMKDASDRVSKALVTELFPEHVLVPLLASRSLFTRFRNEALKIDEVFALRKFSPMGSAVCFPIESIVFWALSVATVLVKSPGYRTLGDPRKLVYVFGDDLIVPSGWASVIMETLEKFCLVFNRDKCFTQGPFRESCGCDAFMGTKVTPIKLKTLFPTSLGQAENVMAWVAYMNRFAAEWMLGTSEYIRELLTPLLGQLPVYNDLESPFLCAFTFSPLVDPIGVEVVAEGNQVDKKQIESVREYNRSRVRGLITPFRKLPRIKPYYCGKQYRKVWQVINRTDPKWETTCPKDRLDYYLLLDWLSQRKEDSDEAYTSHDGPEQPRLKKKDYVKT